MLILLTILSKASVPYWSTFRKQLAEEGVNPITITHAPNLIGHPIGILLLLLSGTFLLPIDPKFYFFWFGLIFIAAISNVFMILGLIHTKFFSTQIIGSLGFLSSSIFAVHFLEESLSTIHIFCLVLATLGVIFFSWPKNLRGFLTFDKGVIFTIIAVIVGGVSSVFHKLATFHVQNYSALVTGRFVVDLIGWTVIWIVSLYLVRKNPFKDLSIMLHKKHGLLFIAGIVISSFIDSWLIYKLPISTIAMIGTLIFPVSYFISYFKYKEQITPPMWLGTLCIVTSVILFLSQIK